MIKDPVMCPCGEPLHYARLADEVSVSELVDELGWNVKVTTIFGSWMVPRHYIALHGISGGSLEVLAKRYGWERVLDG